MAEKRGIKYRDPDRPLKITVRTKATPEEILLEVEDTGSGIEAEHLPKLCNKNSRINTSIEGSGLGLFIVKRMVENRAGRIEVASIVGKGSLFSVFFKPVK